MEYTQVENKNNFEPGVDIVPLPSEGLFYPKIDGELITKVKIRHLTAEDESIMMSPNLIESGDMVDEILNKKVVSPYPVSKMLIGDRMALLIFLRATMEPLYHVRLKDPKTNEEFDHTIDLTQLTLTTLEKMPNKDGLFEFKLSKVNRMVKFRLMTGEDEKIIRNREKIANKKNGGKQNLFPLFKMLTLVTEVEGITDPFEKEAFLKNMPIMDSRRLQKYMNEVVPSLELVIDVPAPSGGNFRQMLPFTAEFLFPSIE